MKKLWLVLLCTTAIESKNISTPALTPEVVQELYDLQKKDPYGRHTLDITGQPGLRNTWNYYVQSTASTLYNLSLTNLLLKSIASLFGMTMLSYAFIAYFIYRVYDLIYKISSWLSWNEEVKSHDMIAEAQHYLKRTQQQLEDTQKVVTRTKPIDSYLCLEKIKEEEKLLRLYLRLNDFLKKRNLRFLFIYDQEKEKQITHALSLLHEVATLSEKRGEHYA